MHAVQQLIHNRLSGKPDNFKLAVVGEVSGQRWPVIAGMASRLTAHGIVADVVGGSSGGGIALMYYATGQFPLGALITRHVSQYGIGRNPWHKFINPWRALCGKPIMDLYSLVNTIMVHHVPLNWGFFKTSTIPTFTIATSQQGQKHVLRLDGQDIPTCKNAVVQTGRIPWVNHAVFDKNVLWDGGLAEALPVDTALALGATHVLALRSKPKNEPEDTTTWFECRVVRPLLAFLLPEMTELLALRLQRAQADILRYQAMEHVLLAEVATLEINSGSVDEQKLFHAVLQGWHCMGEALGLPDAPYPAIWAPDIAKHGLPKALA